MENLTIEKAIELANSRKKIKWVAPIYRANKGFYGNGLAGGIAVIYDVVRSLMPVNENKVHMNCQTIEGDDLNSAFAGGPHCWSKTDFAYSDSDRMVEFEII